MATLRVQKLSSDRGIGLGELSSLTGIDEETLEKYASEDIEINQETAKHLQKIAAKLDIPPAKLIEPVKKEAGRHLQILKALESPQHRGLNFDRLSELSNVHPSMLLLYSTQILSKQKWEEPQTQTDIGAIASVLDASVEDLVIIKDPPTTGIRVADFLEEKGLTIQELSLVSDIPESTINFVASQPIDLVELRNASSVPAVRASSGICCSMLGICC